MDFVKRALTGLARDGLWHLGTVQWSGALVVGDPALLGTTAGRAWSGPVNAGRWHLFARPDEEDEDKVAELYACLESALPIFYDLNDQAGPVAEIEYPSGRIALLDAGKRDDVTLRQSLLEPDDLPWVVDAGVVAFAGRGICQVFRGPGVAQVPWVSVAFGEPTGIVAGAPIAEG